MNISGNKILITGGASGIGFGMAEQFIKDGNTVIICGRREAVLQEAQHKLPALITHRCDLTSEQDRQDLYQWIATEHPDLNVLVNNAGIQQWMSLNDADFYQRARQEMVTNIEAPLHLITLFLQSSSLSAIINVTSGLAFMPFGKTPVYSATKAFLRSFTITLRLLVSDRNIEVIEVIPPALNTDLGGKGLHDFAPPVSGFIESIFSQLKDGKTELTYGFTEALTNAGQDVFQPIYKRINQLP